MMICLLVLGLGNKTDVSADPAHSDYAYGSEQSVKEVVEDGMVPIYGRDVKDGTYEMPVKSSSSFFRITKAVLTVKGEKMSAVITLSSHSYLLLYMGTGEEAAAAPATEYLKPKDDKNGACTFTIPVEALNYGVKCTAFSKKRKKWYDRVLLFDASELPKGTVDIELPDYDKIRHAMRDYESTEQSTGETINTSSDSGNNAHTPTEPMRMSKKDGEYSIEVNMTGGSGRASISSPTLLIIKDGKAYANLIWSSTYYDYMIVGGKKYKNETKDGGNSTFTIPIAAMDRIIPVIADTTAMGDPLEINYSLTFYQNTIGDKGLIPQVAAKKVLVFALIIIVVGAILNHIVKKRRKGK